MLLETTSRQRLDGKTASVKVNVRFYGFKQYLESDGPTLGRCAYCVSNSQNVKNVEIVSKGWTKYISSPTMCVKTKQVVFGTDIDSKIKSKAIKLKDIDSKIKRKTIKLKYNYCIMYLSQRSQSGTYAFFSDV